MDEVYDVIVLGTGLKECILSGIMSVEGKKVLHMDKNDYYGGKSASLNIDQMFEHFKKEGEGSKLYGHNRDWNVDLIPKFIMSAGKLVKALVKTDVTKYLEFKSVLGSYVYKKNKVHKVPSNGQEALKSKLMGMMEKRRFKNFLQYVQDLYFKEKKALKKGYDLDKMTMKELFKKYNLDDNTIDFIGHAMALHREDSYLERPARETVDKINLYINSVSRYGNTPYIYPMYGLGELPQAFARLSAVYGGTYMLHKPIEKVHYGNEGKVIGVESEGETAKCKMVIASPEYFPDKVKVAGQVVRCICFLDHPIPNCNNSESVQLIIPQSEVNRKHDIYVCSISHAHHVSKEGIWVAIVSTTVETENPKEEIKPALALLGDIKEQFYSVDDVLVPTNNPLEDGVFITTGYDATSHFETTMEDVMNVYKSLTGEELQFKKKDKEKDEKVEED
ncbi:guanosine nucleotide diphosphate dissociation inhibitor [Anaeramoeba flamelloides]|uniref:Rab GDP dissociation inhibitor n=1 Tax=Anaeramoeba flamelloides TaxID=1746091 RepID=A0ABQ8ZC37_9EUKA|nr:guanosine nucleotide diphosphate dissociation inhibitor [Anaeramoeba flamelloides]